MYASKTNSVKLVQFSVDVDKRRRHFSGYTTVTLAAIWHWDNKTWRHHCTEIHTKYYQWLSMASTAQYTSASPVTLKFTDFTFMTTIHSFDDIQLLSKYHRLLWHDKPWNKQTSPTIPRNRKQ